MKLIKTEEMSPVARRLTVEVDKTEAKKALDKAYRSLSGQVRIKGFRPGKAPRSILERYYGTQVNQEVAQDLIRNSADEALEASGLSPVVQPQAEAGVLKPDEPFTYTLDLEIKPEIEIEGYFGLELTKKERTVGDELVESRLQELAQAHAKLETAPEDAAVQAGDYVTADLEAFQEDKAVPKGKLEKFDLLIGRGNFNRAVEEALVGLKREEEVTVPTEFSAKFFHDALAGKKLEMKAKVLEIRRPVAPELNDEFAKSMGQGLETLDGLKKMIRERLEQAANQESDRELQDALLDELLKKVEFEPPVGMVDLELRRMVAQVENSLIQRGLNFQAAGIDGEKLENDIRPQALRRVQEDLILEAIALKEKLEIDDEALEEGFKELAEGTGQDLGEIKKFHEEQNLTESFKSGLLRRQTLKRLIDESKITTVPFEEEAPENEEKAEQD